MSASFQFARDIAWLEGDLGGGSAPVVWISNLETGVQYELNGTSWLTWMLLSDGLTEVSRLHAELQSIHAELHPDGTTPAISEDALMGFLGDLERDGLLVRG